MKKPILISLLTLLTLVATAQKSQSYLNYIKQYAPLAQEEQRRHHIPASITLAQGLLESGAGQSELARKSNNHFGIKCGSSWTGASTYHDDDRRGECFRKYSHPSQSYTDHSIFLKKERYASLFKLRITDYKGWAHGLKKAGYATDPRYAYKLIDIIETYDLNSYDRGASVTTSKPSTSSSRLEKRTKRKDDAQTTRTKRTSRKGRSRHITQPVATAATVTAATTSSMGTVASYTPHRTYRNNGVRYVRAVAGDTYASIAGEFGISLKEILHFNDLTADQPLADQELVYLSWKKTKGRTTYHTVKAGESARSIAQKHGVRMSKIYDINNIPYTESVKIGQRLRLK